MFSLVCFCVFRFLVSAIATLYPHLPMLEREREREREKDKERTLRKKVTHPPSLFIFSASHAYFLTRVSKNKNNSLRVQPEIV